MKNLYLNMFAEENKCGIIFTVTKNICMNFMEVSEEIMEILTARCTRPAKIGLTDFRFAKIKSVKALDSRQVNLELSGKKT